MNNTYPTSSQISYNSIEDLIEQMRVKLASKENMHQEEKSLLLLRASQIINEENFEQYRSLRIDSVINEFTTMVLEDMETYDA